MNIQDCITIQFIMHLLCYGQEHEPPQFVHTPNPNVIYAIPHRTTEINVSCEAVGNPTVNYRWLKNNHDFEYQGPPSDNDTTGQLRLPFSGADQSGTYQCVAYNDYGSAYDRPIKVEIAYMGMYPTSRPEVIQVDEGSTFQRRCEAPDSNPPAKAFWILKNRGQPNMFTSINSTNIVMDDMGTLFFQRVSNEDIMPDFFFTCAAENHVLKDYKFGPQFTFEVRKRSATTPTSSRIQYSSPKSIRVVKGVDLNLYCVYEGRDMAIIWKKNDENVSNGPTTHEIKSMGKVLKLKIDNISDGGKYSCMFPEDHSMDRQFEVTVEEPPYWKNSAPRSLTSKLGDTVEFDCSADGRPVPSIKFYKNGVEIPSQKYHIDGSKLKIVNVESSHAAVYQCNASNVHGYLWSNFYLNIMK